MMFGTRWIVETCDCCSPSIFAFFLLDPWEYFVMSISDFCFMHLVYLFYKIVYSLIRLLAFVIKNIDVYFINYKKVTAFVGCCAAKMNG